MKNKTIDIQYGMFDHIVVRTPLYPFKTFRDKSKINSESFYEGLFIATPDFFNEYHRKPEQYKAQCTLYKYYSRMCSRCTPFGMFASCSVFVNNDTKNEVILSAETETIFLARLDFSVINKIIKHVEQDPIIKSQIRYYSNNSIYYIGNSFRFIEKYEEANELKFRIVEIQRDEYNDKIVSLAKNGASWGDIIDFLTKKGIEKEDAIIYIEDLVSSQVLNSELGLKLTGMKPLRKLLQELYKINNANHWIDSLVKIEELLNNIPTHNVLKTKHNINLLTSELDKLGIAYIENKLVQIDSFRPCKGSISTELKDEILKLVQFLNNIPIHSSDRLLYEFIDKFRLRYENEMVDLLEVLDTDIGINFLKKNSSSFQLVNLLNDKSHKIENNLVIDDISKILLGKYVDAVHNNENVINLTEQDFETQSIDHKDIPQTFSVLCSIVSTAGKIPMVFVKNIGGTSAANLLGRFGYLNEELKTLCRNIYTHEANYYSNCIVAEVVHLPDSRMGNVLFREVTRKYEISCITLSTKSQEFQIPLSDLMLYVVGNDICLYSKRLQKRIIPFISTAHNYTLNTQPLYHFLGLLQQHNLKCCFSVKYSPIFYGFNYLPRIMWHSFILERAKWKIKKEYIASWKNMCANELFENIIQWRVANIPQYCVYSEGDNDLLIDFSDIRSIVSFISYVKVMDIWIEEFLFDEEHPMVKNKEGAFCNEFIFSCYTQN